MNSKAAIENLHAAIIESAAQKLDRDLTSKEKQFVVSRGGFIALEMIFDTVNAANREEIEQYLNSE